MLAEIQLRTQQSQQINKMLELLPCTLKSNNEYNKMDILKIAIWNANGLLQRLQELKVFINTNKVNVLLISEIHL
jgi:hypothetical protein